ncbi:hypothetical protein EI94DRAFT_1744446 [Lactarius quietus]|nr:hypothetical protein EI94DRAFT_1744446 [Lactarius quietus]
MTQHFLDRGPRICRCLQTMSPLFLSCTEESHVEPAPGFISPTYVNPSADSLVAILKSEFPSLIDTPGLLHSMNAQRTFKQGKPSDSVTTLLERVQSTDPSSPDIDEDNVSQSWGHYQFTAGGLSPLSSLTSWQNIGNVATAFKLVAAAIKTCQDAHLMCAKAGTPKTTRFISDVYLEKICECLKKFWVDAGGVLSSQPCAAVIPTTPDVVMSSPVRKRPMLTMKIKQPTFTSGDIAVTPSEVPQATSTDAPGSTSQQQPTTSTELCTELLALLNEDAHTNIALLKALQVPELINWITHNGVSMPKSRRKDCTSFILRLSPSPSSTRSSRSTSQRKACQHDLLQLQFLRTLPCSL